MKSNGLRMGEDDGELDVVHETMHAINPIFKDFVITIIWWGVVRL